MDIVTRFLEKRKLNKLTASKLNIPVKEAAARMEALGKSGFLEDNPYPEDRLTQCLIENYIRFDHKNLDYKEVHLATLNFPELVLEYDKKFDRNLTKALNAIRKTSKLEIWSKIELERFDTWLAVNFWNYLPGVEKY